MKTVSDKVYDFLIEATDIIGGENAILRYKPEELLELLKEMSTSHEEYQNMLECKEAAEAHELFNPVVCDI